MYKRKDMLIMKQFSNGNIVQNEGWWNCPKWM